MSTFLEDYYASFFIIDLLSLDKLPENRIECMVKKFNRCFKKVQIQGVVVLLDFVKSIAIKYAVDDGTGIVFCVEYFDGVQSGLQKYKIGDVVQIFGQLSSFRDERQIKIISSLLRNDVDDESLHFLEVLKCYKIYQEPKVAYVPVECESVNKFFIPKRIEPEVKRAPKKDQKKLAAYEMVRDVWDIMFEGRYRFIKKDDVVRRLDIIELAKQKLSERELAGDPLVINSNIREFLELVWAYMIKRGRIYPLLTLSVNKRDRITPEFMKYARNNSKLQKAWHECLSNLHTDVASLLENIYYFVTIEEDIKPEILELLRSKETLSISQIENSIRNMYSNLFNTQENPSMIYVALKQLISKNLVYETIQDLEYRIVR